MKKPNFIEVRIALKTKPVSPIVEGYFKRLVGKVLQVNFAERRTSKLFDYEVKDAGVVEKWEGWGGKYKRVLYLELAQIVPDCYKKN